MKKENELIKPLISPPGDTLNEHLDFIGMEESELAEKMNVSKEKIEALICGREPISDEMATQLENMLRILSCKSCIILKTQVKCMRNKN